MIKLLVTGLLFGWVISCDSSKSEPDAGPPVLPDRSLNAAFLVVDGVYNSELIAPMDVFHHTVFHTEYGIKVFTVAPRKDTITSFEGLRFIPDYSFVSDSLPSIDILIVPSAQHSMSSDLENKELIRFVQTTGKKALYVISLCDGAFVLAKAGLLDTYHCTTFPGDIHKFREAFPQLNVHENVSFIHDKRMITSAGGAKSYDPALYLVELLYGKKAAEGIATGLVIEWDLNAIKHTRFE
jgi:transcriptional regulator GlxA family with amidase domain